MQAITRNIGAGLLIALLCSACITSGAIHDGITNAKSIWFLLICGFILFYQAATHSNRSITFKPGKLDLAISLFLFYAIANNANQDMQMISRKNLENFGLLIAYFFSRTLFSDDKFAYRTFFALILVLVFSQIVIAYSQWFDFLPSHNSHFRISGIFFNPAPFSIFLSAMAMFCLTGYLYSTDRFIRTFGISLFVLSIPVVLILLSRSAWLGFLLGTVLVLVDKFKLTAKASDWFKRTSIRTIVITLITFIPAYAATYLYHLKKESADGRLLVWKLSFRIISDRPWGVGQENFAAWFLKYQSAYFEQHPEKMGTEGRLADTVHYAFNDILQITAEQGFPGLALFGVLLLTTSTFARKLIKRLKVNPLSTQKGLLIGGVSSVVIILVSGLFSYPLVMLPLKILFFVSLGIISGNYNAIFIVKRNSPPDKRGLSIISQSMLFTIFGTCFMASGILLTHGYYLEQTIAENGYEDNSIESLQRYPFILSTEPWYALRQCDYLLYTGKYQEAIQKLEKAKAITSDKSVYLSLGNLYAYQRRTSLAEAQYKFLYYALPGLVRPKYELAKFYYDTGQKSKWEKAARELIHFKPKVRSVLSDGMIEEIKKMR